MKKLITLSLIALSAIQTVEAKRTGNGFIPGGKSLVAAGAANKQTATVSGTLSPESFSTGSPCLNSIFTYRDSSRGYYAGVNVYGDKEIAMRYALSEYSIGLPTRVDTVKAFFGAKYVGSNGSVRAKVYAASSTGAPAALLGTSANISVSALDTTGGVTNFVFTTPVSLTTSTFFVAIDVSSLYATRDTVGLFSTDDACASTNRTDAWTKQADDNFYAFSDATNNYGFALDIAIFAHVNATTLSVGNAVANQFNANVYPVPATGKLNVAFTGRSNGQVTLTLKDITGKTAAASNVVTTTGATFKTTMDISTLRGGLYFLDISSGEDKSTLKVLVQ